jgi:hypothetical protein
MESDAIFASSPVEVTQGSDHQFRGKAMIPTFVTASGRLILDALPKGSKFNQDDFIDNLLLALNQVKTGNARLKVATTLMVPMNT